MRINTDDPNPAVIADGRAGLAHGLADDAVGNDPFRPQGGGQFVLVDGPMAVHQQVANQFQRLGLYGHGLTLPEKLARVPVQLEGVEAVQALAHRGGGSCP